MKKYRVFVYGSLKKGFSNHHLLENQIYLGNTLTKQNQFKMHHLGHYPGITTGGNKHIFGEVYEIDEVCLNQLDHLENNGVEYSRCLIDLMNFEKAWMYFYQKELPQNDASLSNYYPSFQTLESDENIEYIIYGQKHIKYTFKNKENE